MNVKRFTARHSREALNLVRQAFGDDAVVLSTRPCAEGVEVLAMGPEGLQQIETAAAQAPLATPQPRAPQPPPAAAPRAKPAARAEQPVEQDVEQLSMSTLSFQDYVRERMLRKREAELKAEAAAAEPVRTPRREPLREELARAAAPAAHAGNGLGPMGLSAPLASSIGSIGSTGPIPVVPSLAMPTAAAPAPAQTSRSSRPASATPSAAAGDVRRDAEMLSELRSMKGLIEERFGALAFMEKLQRQPGQARLTQKLLDCGFSPALIRKLVDGLPQDVADEAAWAAGVLARNLAAAEDEPALEDVGGVYALVGSTGVGKTTSTAKIAAAFATKHGAANLGLVTLDAYRVAAHEQLRAYGRILGVPVHTAHDRASLEDLLDLLSGKRMVLIDTAGMAQRDARTRELLDMLGHRAIQKLLVVNASAQGETIEDVMVSYRAATCRGVVLSKIDEAVKLGPALDALIRHRQKVLGVANGQRVPEDWHRLSAQALVQRALRAGGSGAWRLDASDVSLVFAGGPVARACSL